MSYTYENNISTIIPEYYSHVTSLVIFQKYLNFNDISIQCTRVFQGHYEVYYYEDFYHEDYY